MVKIARPSRIVSEFDTLDVYFTGCSVLDGQLTLWGQLNGIDDPDVSLLTQLDERINAESETPELERVVPGDTYLVKYTLDNKWYRAKVMNYYTDSISSKPKYRVQYTDFGNVDVVPLSLIRPISQSVKEFKGRLSLAYKFKLAHTIGPREGGAWDVNGGLLRWIDKEIVLNTLVVRVIKINADDEFVIECDAINTVLQKHNFCSIIDVRRSLIRGYISDIDPFDPLNFCIQHDDHDGESLEKFSKMINNVYKNEIAPAKLAKSLCLPGTYCISLYKDRSFYRAQIISSDLAECTSTIRYIDYGNLVRVPSNSLCVIQSQFVDVPPYALQCRIHNLKIIQGQETAVYDEMKALTSHQLVVASIVYCEQRQVTQVYHVTCAVLQNKFNPQAAIQLKCLNFTQRVQEDVTTRPKSRSPLATRAGLLSRAASQLTRLFDSLSKPVSIEPRLRHACLIAWIQSPLDIHLHREGEIEQLEQYSARLNRFYQEHHNRRPVVTNPGMTDGHYYVAKWSRDGAYYRIRYDGAGDVYFVDFGNRSVVAPLAEASNAHIDFVSNEIYHLDATFSRAPFAISASISHSIEGLRQLYEQQTTIHAVFRRIKNGKWLIELENEDQISSGSDDLESVFDQLECHTDYPCRFSFIDDADNRLYIHFAAFDADLAALETQIEALTGFVPTQPQIGAHVLAHYHQDGRIHRARVLDIGEVDVLVKFVDYGNTDRVTPDLLFACPLFSYPPAFAFEVEIDALDLAQLDDPNGFFNFLHHFLDVDLCANIVTKCYPTLKVDLSLEQSGDDLVKCAFESYIKSLIGCETLQYYYEATSTPVAAAIDSSISFTTTNTTHLESSTIISPDAAPFVPRNIVQIDLNNNVVPDNTASANDNKSIDVPSRCLHKALQRIIGKLLSNQTPRRIVWWRANQIGHDSNAKPTFECEVYRDGLDSNFVPIGRLISRLSTSEVPRLVWHRGHFFLVAKGRNGDDISFNLCSLTKFFEVLVMYSYIFNANFSPQNGHHRTKC